MPSLQSTPDTLRDTWEFETVTACPHCAATRFGSTFSRRIRGIPLDFVTCESCGLMFQNPRLTREALAGYFSSKTFLRDSDASDYRLHEPLGYHDYEDWDASYKSTGRLRMERILRFKQPPGNLLEIGTATGSFLDVARRYGFSVRGLDLSRSFAEMARTRYGLEIDSDFIEEAPLPEAHFDVVCAFGGIACWRDPVRGLSNIRRGLKPGGVFVLNYSVIDSLPGRLLGDRYPEFNHASLTIFSTASMRKCLEAAGLRLIFSETERQYASIGRIVTYLKSRKGRWLAGKLGIAHVTVPLLAVGTIFGICEPVDPVSR